MTELTGELIGTFILILLGNGVVANVNLNKAYSHGGGWIVIAAGWAMAVFVAVLATADISGEHINPAVTLGLAFSGLFEWGKVVPFIVAQMLGAMLGAFVVYIFFLNDFKITTVAGPKRACFCTTPAIRQYWNNFFSELTGTFVLVLSVFLIPLPELEYISCGNTKVGLGSLGALPVALVVFSLGLSLGGTTGYAINPARDLGPRIIHAILPLKNKDNNDWQYSWIPVFASVAAAAAASVLYYLLLL